jgi:hypothetical protein
MGDTAGRKRISAVWKFQIFYSSDSDLDPFLAKSAKELGRFARRFHLRSSATSKAPPRLCVSARENGCSDRRLRSFCALCDFCVKSDRNPEFFKLHVRPDGWPTKYSVAKGSLHCSVLAFGRSSFGSGRSNARTARLMLLRCPSPSCPQIHTLETCVEERSNQVKACFRFSVVPLA